MQVAKAKYLPIIHLSLLAMAILIAYSSVFGAGFMSWDDPEYVLHNADIQNITADAIKNWFTHFYIGNYHPLTLLSYAIDYLVGKQEPFTYHLTNILLHIINAGLVYVFVNRIQQNKWVGFFVALLFALHPVQTETVSWVAERKNVLYALFFLGSLICYAGYIIEDRRKLLVAAFILGLASMLCKPAAVTLPLALIAVDVWMHRNISSPKVWLQKVPFLVLSIVFGLIALKAQKQGNFLDQHPEFGILDTILFAGYAYVQYIINLFAPVKLSVLYPYPQSAGAIQTVYTLIAAGIMVLGVIAYKKKWYILSGGILFYTVNIALVLQFVQFGEVLMADRYLYIPCLGIWLPMVYYLYEAIGQKGKEIVVSIILCVVALVFLFATQKRNNIWLSELAFWQSVTDTFPESAVAQSSVGGVYMKQGDYDVALEHIQKAVTLDDKNYKAWYNLGVLHLRRGKYKEAEDALDRCIAINEYSKALFSRALLFQQTGQYLRALNDINKVLEKEPNNARAYYVKGSCEDEDGDYQQAIGSFNKAIEYGDGDPIFYLGRGIAEVKSGNAQDAITDMGHVIDHNPKSGQAWYWRGLAKEQIGLEPCHDLNMARNLHYREAEAALIKYCND
ncbi:MAG: tetratricopeptide repeat protein [Bacteroidetes bacterium]|nr:tetratricopeptide repeat protein [Bacteroidota bacterium]